MLNENAKKWVAALRSGEYTQGTGQLRSYGSPGDFCCLGVACDLYRQETGIQWDADVISQRLSYLGRDGNLPEEVREWLGLRDNNGSFDESPDSLSRLNDRGHDFEYITDIIESDPTGLFCS